MGRFEHPADTNATTQVYIAANLSTTSDRGPGIDHGTAAHPRANIHIAGHQDDSFFEERTIAGDCMGHHPHTQRLIIALERDFIIELKGAHLYRLHLLQRKKEHHRLFHPVIDSPDPPLCGGRISYPQLPEIELLHHQRNSFLYFFVIQQRPVFPCSFD